MYCLSGNSITKSLRATPNEHTTNSCLRETYTKYSKAQQFIVRRTSYNLKQFANV